MLSPFLDLFVLYGLFTFLTRKLAPVRDVSKWLSWHFHSLPLAARVPIMVLATIAGIPLFMGIDWLTYTIPPRSAAPQPLPVLLVQDGLFLLAVLVIWIGNEMDRGEADLHDRNASAVRMRMSDGGNARLAQTQTTRPMVVRVLMATWESSVGFSIVVLVVIFFAGLFLIVPSIGAQAMRQSLHEVRIDSFRITTKVDNSGNDVGETRSTYSATVPRLYWDVDIMDWYGTHRLSVNWYAPNERLYYRSVDKETDIAESWPFHWNTSTWNDLRIAGTPAQRLTGTWTVRLLIDGQVRETTQFQLVAHRGS
jgi:hypothetical protein